MPSPALARARFPKVPSHRSSARVWNGLAWATAGPVVTRQQRGDAWVGAGHHPPPVLLPGLPSEFSKLESTGIVSKNGSSSRPPLYATTRPQRRSQTLRRFARSSPATSCSLHGSRRRSARRSLCRSCRPLSAWAAERHGWPRPVRRSSPLSVPAELLRFRRFNGVRLGGLAGCVAAAVVHRHVVVLRRRAGRRSLGCVRMRWWLMRLRPAMARSCVRVSRRALDAGRHRAAPHTSMGEANRQHG